MKTPHPIRSRYSTFRTLVGGERWLLISARGLGVETLIGKRGEHT